jgi:hypothetical protein
VIELWSKPAAFVLTIARLRCFSGIAFVTLLWSALPKGSLQARCSSSTGALPVSASPRKPGEVMVNWAANGFSQKHRAQLVALPQRPVVIKS